jgi:hypothetical protein
MTGFTGRPRFASGVHAMLLLAVNLPQLGALNGQSWDRMRLLGMQKSVWFVSS